MAWNQKACDALEHGRIAGLEIDDVDSLDPKGLRNYLHVAAGAGQVESVRWLLDHHASVDGTAQWTPLHAAAEMGFTEICELLLARGADPHAVEFGRAGGTPLILALFYGHAETADLLATFGVTPQNLRAAAGLGRVDLLKSWHGTPQAAVDRVWFRPHDEFPDWTPSNDEAEILNEALVYAAANGRLEAVRWLLSCGAQADAVPYWCSALHIAIYHGHDDVIDALLETDPDLTIVDRMYDARPCGWANHVGRHELAAQLKVDPPDAET